MTANQTTFKCLDWNNPELAIRSKELQNIRLLLLPCHHLPYLEGIDLYTEDYKSNPVWFEMNAKQCGAIPEDYEGNHWYYYS